MSFRIDDIYMYVYIYIYIYIYNKKGLGEEILMGKVKGNFYICSVFLNVYNYIIYIYYLSNFLN